jgi:hypothetical protein
MDVKSLLLHFGDRRVPLQIDIDGRKRDIEEVARGEFGRIRERPIVQIWSPT